MGTVVSGVRCSGVRVAATPFPKPIEVPSSGAIVRADRRGACVGRGAEGLQPRGAATGRVHVGAQTRRGSVAAVGLTASGRSGPPSEVGSALSPLPKSMPSSDRRRWTRHHTPRGRAIATSARGQTRGAAKHPGVTRPRRPPRRPITTQCRRPEGPKNRVPSNSEGMATQYPPATAENETRLRLTVLDEAQQESCLDARGRRCHRAAPCHRLLAQPTSGPPLAGHTSTRSPQLATRFRRIGDRPPETASRQAA
jgi:hypothetical protein